jgi:hypothetical protein
MPRTYAAVFKTHGLKIIYAQSVSQATRIATDNACGTPPLFVRTLRASEREAARQLMVLGWRGDLNALKQELGA